MQAIYTAPSKRINNSDTTYTQTMRRTIIIIIIVIIIITARRISHPLLDDRLVLLGLLSLVYDDMYSTVWKIYAPLPVFTTSLVMQTAPDAHGLLLLLLQLSSITK
jgi:hypothetical protein